MEASPDLEQEIELARRAALSLLSRRDHACRELSEKLQQRGFSSLASKAVIEDFEQKNWLDDQAFALRFAVVKAERLYGPQRIAMQLRRLGVEDSLVQQAITEARVDWSELAEHCLHKRFSRVEDEDHRTSQKQQRYLYQRGYLPEHFERLFS
jgi:regulatory protein